LEIAAKAGFKNISCDLIFNLPLQKYHHIEKDIRTLEKNDIKHISLYSLKINPETKIKKIIEKDSYRLMDEDEERDIYYKSRDLLHEKNYMQYEISNFSKNGYESKHNLKYWNREEYIGIGASAHSFINERRFSNISNVENYIERVDKGLSTKDFEELVEKNEAAWEYLILGLRKTEGINIRKFEENYRVDIKTYKEKIRDLEEKGLIKLSGDRLKLTKKGMDLSNYVFVILK
jgi:oxygen-independent coproporphyrinogen-3 oxidase